jgi:hypothetical protein
MNLTEFVSEPDVRERIGETYPNGGERASEPLQAEWQTQHYTLVGTAFDYLLRFWLRRHVETVETRPWVAWNGLRVAERDFPDYAQDIRATIDRVEGLRDEFLETGQLTRPLIEGAIDLARIDAVYRGGVPPEGLGQYDDGDVVDLLRLLELLDGVEAFKRASHAVLNPAFGLASTLVGGADADAIIDGTLVDVKATSKATFKVSYWRQLVGYLVLADVHRTLEAAGVYDEVTFVDERNARPLPDIDEFGVYFARHGELSTVSADRVYEADAYLEFRSWFVRAALDTTETLDDAHADIVRDLV